MLTVTLTVAKPSIRTQGGRHPLQELVVDAFIPNDTLLAEPAGTIGLITGANYSGKSVYLKQVRSYML
jgi:DNA mismatch repair protein MSH5